MAIEFECPQCRATLRVEDDARGKKAECPQCGQISQLPSEITPTPPTVAPLLSEQVTDSQFSTSLAKGPLLPARIDLGQVISRSWNILGQQYSTGLAASAIFLALSIGVGTAANMIADLGNVVGDPISLAFVGELGRWVFDTWLFGGMALFFLKVARGQRADLSNLFAGGRYLWRLLVIKFFGALLFLGILFFGSGVPAMIGYLVTEDVPAQQHIDRVGQVKAKGVAAEADSAEADTDRKEKQKGEESIEERKSDEPQAGELPPPKDQDKQSVEVGVASDGLQTWSPKSRRDEVALTAAVFGFLLCSIPLVYLGLMFSQAFLLVIDRQMGAIEALRQSMRITRGNKLSLLVLGLLAFVLFFGGILTCCIGLIFVLPFVCMLGVTAYLAMTSQISEI